MTRLKQKGFHDITPCSENLIVLSCIYDLTDFDCSVLNLYKLFISCSGLQCGESTDQDDEVKTENWVKPGNQTEPGWRRSQESRWN